MMFQEKLIEIESGVFDPHGCLKLLEVGYVIDNKLIVLVVVIPPEYIKCGYKDYKSVFTATYTHINQFDLGLRQVVFN